MCSIPHLDCRLLGQLARNPAYHSETRIRCLIFVSDRHFHQPPLPIKHHSASQPLLAGLGSHHRQHPALRSSRAQAYTQTSRVCALRNHKPCLSLAPLPLSTMSSLLSRVVFGYQRNGEGEMELTYSLIHAEPRDEQEHARNLFQCADHASAQGHVDLLYNHRRQYSATETISSKTAGTLARKKTRAHSRSPLLLNHFGPSRS